jgi:hypothetical protein
MSNLHSRRILGNLAFWDTHRNRIVEAIGPGVAKFNENFVGTPLPSADAPASWTVTLVEAGAGESTVALDSGMVGGGLVITTDAADNDGVNMQVKGEAFKLVADKPLYFGARFKISEVTQSDVLVGLCITDTDLLGGMTDGVYFRKVDASTALKFTLELNSSETDGTVQTMVADTFYTVEFFFDGTNVDSYVDGVLQTRLAMTNLCQDEELTPSIHFLAGDANARTATIDWIRCFQFNS